MKLSPAYSVEVITDDAASDETIDILISCDGT